LKTCPWIACFGATTEHSIARQMSCTCTSGRHGEPSLVIAMRLVVQASPLRLFSTMSKRIRGDAP
jgi:hypothetical protein